MHAPGGVVGPPGGGADVGVGGLGGGPVGVPGSFGCPGVHCLKKVLPKQPEPAQQGMAAFVHSVQGARHVCAVATEDAAARETRANVFIVVLLCCVVFSLLLSLRQEMEI